MDYQESDPRIKTNDFSIESSSEEEDFRSETLIEDTKPVVTENYQFENADELKLVAQLESSDSQNSEARKEIDGFQLKTPAKV